MKIYRNIPRLIAKHKKGKLNDQEYQELEDWVTESEENMQQFLKLTGNALSKPKYRFTERRLLSIVKYAAAAAIVIVFAYQSYRVLSGQTKQNPPALAKLYSVTTTAGKQDSVILPDGTKAWLNDSSYISYPETFDKDKRVVDIYGEVYFDKKHPGTGNGQNELPFIVNARDKGVKIYATGTRFNVRAYKGEEIKAMLLEGAISVKTKNDSSAVTPGHQAIIKASGKIDTDTVAGDAAIAWKGGYMQFTDATIQEVIAQLRRKYNKEFVCKADNVGHINITIEKSKPLATALQVIEKMKLVRFEIDKDQKSVTVLNY